MPGLPAHGIRLLLIKCGSQPDSTMCLCPYNCRWLGTDFVPGLPVNGTCLLLSSGEFGMLRAEDAERLQVRACFQVRVCACARFAGGWRQSVPGSAVQRMQAAVDR